jgi:phage terminase large subunit
MKDLVALTVKAYNDGKRYIVNEGGTRSSKTFSVLLALYLIASSKRVLISIVSETFPHLRKGAIRDFELILQNAKAWQPDSWAKGESTYTLPNGSKIEFFSVDSPGKVHGPARDILFINEGQSISWDITRHLFVRTKGTIFVDFNPTHEFWAHTELKEDAGTEWVHSTYLDNPFLEPEQVREIERNRKNETWWRVYGEGLVGQYEGLIFPEIELVDEMPGHESFYGLDFGYTNDPSALIQVQLSGEAIYLNELVYETGLRNIDLSKKMADAGLTKQDSIFADSAEPKSIDDLYYYGWNVYPAEKGRDSIMYGIDLMRQYTIRITKQSINLIKEFRNYRYDQDKEGNNLNKPIDTWNHGIDAARYAVVSRLKERLEYTDMSNNNDTLTL